jgi:trehalose/maltose hydrolase-like predicted phosphorylase
MSAVDRFYENQTPANAVRLAKADHDALNMGNGIREFEHQLNVAAARLDVYDELVAALRDCKSAIHHAMRADDFTGDYALDLAAACNKARVAIERLP